MIPLISKGAIRFQGGYFYADLSLEEQYTTNARANNDAVEDLITTVTPRVAYKTEEATLIWEASAAVNFVRYSKLEDDNDDISLQFTASYPNGIEVPYSFNTKLSATESTQSNSEFGEVTRDRNYNASIDGSYDVSTLYSISSGVDYRLTEPLSGDRSEISSYGLPITVNYNYSEVLSYGIGYRIRKEDSNSGQLENISSVDHALFGVANGQIFPLIDGSLELGAQLRQLDNGDSEDNELSPYASVDLTWQATGLTTCSLGLSSDFQTTTGNQSIRRHEIDIGISHEFGANLSGNLSLSFQQTNFSDFLDSTSGSNETRDDSTWNFGTGLRTKYGETTNLAINLEYTQNDSSESRFTYTELAFTFKITQKF